MGLLIKIIFIILLIVAVAHFTPKIYDTGRTWTSDKIGELTTEKVGSSISSFTDITTYSCDTSEDCVNHFKINGLTCSMNKCVVI